MPAAAPDPNPSAELPRDYLNRLLVGDHPSHAESPSSGLVGYLLARRHRPEYWAGVEELARRVDAAKGVPLGSTLAALIKKLYLPTE